MFLNDIVDALTVKEAKTIKQRLDAKCWTGKHKEGTKIKGGVRVNNCVPNESVEEAANAAQQAAIAINMKKHHKKPKSEGVAEGQRWPDDRNSLSKNDRDIELINPKDADVKWKDRKIATKISPSITKTTVDRLDRNTTVPNFLKKKTKEDSTNGQVDEILGFQTAKPAAKKPNTSLSQMRKEFEKEPVAPQPKVVQSRDADEKKAREVHKQYAEEDASGWPFKNGIDEDSWSDGQGQWSSEHDQWAHESLNEYPAAASVPADSSSAIPGTPGLNESQQQRLERLEIQWRLQEMKAAGYDL